MSKRRSSSKRRRKRRPYSSNESCSPRKDADGGGAQMMSCFPYQSLARIARRYNEANPRDRITMHRSRDKLWRAIKRKMPQCANERCWTRAQYLSDDDRRVLLEDFKPPLPQGKYTWLNTDDIDRVLHRYERVFPHFKYLGTHPIDFQQLPELRHLNPLRLNTLRGKKMAGLVLNLDEHDEPGSHWVAVLLNLPQRTFEYFDSYGDAAPREVKQFFNQLNRRTNQKWRFRENRQVHQLRNSECGVYSIHFIVRRLNGEPFQRVTNDIIRDAAMNRKRRVYFDPHHTYDNKF